jgi:AraC-binding-like domain/Bacterial regulatory helix-turn-helix proteins, AraC family
MPDVARTLDLPSGQRFEYWKHVLSNTFVPLEVWSPGGGDDFRGLLRGCELGSLRFIEVSAEAHTARRTARLVKAAPAGCYKIGLQLRGSSVLIQDGREATLTPGDFTLYDTDRPYTLAFSDPHRMLVLVFPGARWGYPDPAHFSRLFKAAYGVGPRDYRAVAYSPGQAACAGVQDGQRPTA